MKCNIVRCAVASIRMNCCSFQFILCVHLNYVVTSTFSFCLHKHCWTFVCIFIYIICIANGIVDDSVYLLFNAEKKQLTESENREGRTKQIVVLKFKVNHRKRLNSKEYETLYIRSLLFIYFRVYFFVLSLGYNFFSSSL